MYGDAADDADNIDGADGGRIALAQLFDANYILPPHASCLTPPPSTPAESQLPSCW